MYLVALLPGARRELERIDAVQRRRLLAAMSDLASNPRPAGAVKLTGRDGWRIRVGDFRVLYQIRDQQLLVLIVRVAHRREAYR